MTLRITLVCLALVLGACVGTPLPQPPNADPTEMRVEGDVLVGLEGAIDPGGIDLEVSWSPSPAGTSPLGPEPVPTAPDGSFRTPPILFEGTGVVWIVAVLPDEAHFLGAVRADGSATVTEETEYPDDDDDGWPDFLDCAPADPETFGPCTP